MVNKNTINKKVSVVIPTFNGLELLKKNLPSVFSCLRDGDEVVIIDDASTDDTVEYLQNNYKDKNFKLIINKENKRFAESCNIAVNETKHSNIFLINNDVSPHKDVLKYLLRYFEDDSVFAVGCKEIEGASDKNLANPDKIEKTILGGKNKLWFEKGLFTHSRADRFISGDTAWVSGGSGMFSKEKWIKLGGFDKRYYPAYWEDIDLSFRARKKGWKILFSEKALVDHNHESTNSEVFGDNKMVKISWKNADTFAWVNGSLIQKLLFIFWRPYWIYKRKRSLSASKK